MSLINLEKVSHLLFITYYKAQEQNKAKIGLINKTFKDKNNSSINSNINSSKNSNVNSTSIIDENNLKDMANMF